ncbi:Peptidase inhibitor family I36 [Streptomyces sp. TLI_053]|uniref:peptidase inhibitor family I36 protein n=1 Tax=Streptomyces sp. TLI_053 TaxID=1855352 RepID=UPI00087D8D45|nr:peptidase inhibitor family I36 protein [Streptomyces sp. TLI_053]SDS56360.1 Peptidase inhibitor family I36 [Streptomyces sp. TLI_053]
MNSRTKFTLAMTVGLFGSALVLSPAAQASNTTISGYETCGSGWICFYSEQNGNGQKCQWSENAPNARPQCSWMAGGTKTRSVYNHTGDKYEYFHNANYSSRIGSTTAGNKGNLAGTYTIGSLRRA